VVGMKVGDEGPRQLVHVDAGLGGAAYKAWASIDDVDVRARNDRDGGSAVIGFGIGRAGAEEDDARVLRPPEGGEECQQGRAGEQAVFLVGGGAVGGGAFGCLAALRLALLRLNLMGGRGLRLHG